MELLTTLLILVLVGMETCAKSATGPFQHWQKSVTSWLQKGSSMADSSASAFASAYNGSTHREIMQELDMSYSEIQAGGCDYSSVTYGGGGGGPFNDNKCTGTVSKIYIRSGSVIDAIQVTFKLPNGQTTTGDFHGGNGGGPETVNINVDQGEKIIAVFGKSGAEVDQLGFATNHGRILGPFGGCGGGQFTVNNCELRGIFGRSGSRLDGIGFLCSNVQ